MATATLLAQSSETWIYPAKSYLGVDYVNRPKNTWTKNHSSPSKRAYRYQSGVSDKDGDYNGNMMSHFHFAINGQSMRTFIRNIGGPEKITSIKLRLSCGHAYYDSMNFRVCLGPYWDTSPYHGKKADSYDGLGIKYLTTVNIPEGGTRTVDLTAYKNHFSNYETITMYVPEGYDKDFQAYGFVYGHTGSTTATRPQLTITYSTNSAPRTPGLNVTSKTDSLGYTVPKLSANVVNNGDPDNNIHSTPFAFQLRDKNGTLFKEYTWQSSSTFYHDLSAYRGQPVKLRGIIRDKENLTSYIDKTVYINSLPYWQGHTAEATAINFTSGVTDSIYKQNITMTWPRASDAQNQTIKYSVYCQIGVDAGPSGDTDSCCLIEGLTTNTYTFDATNIKGKVIPKGERIYVSVWAHDGLEWSPHRLVSKWIYREQPPTSPTNVTPIEGHYESTVNVSWSQSSGSNGSYIEMYRVGLMDNTNSIIKSWNVAETNFTCNDLSYIPRGETFKFCIVAVDNLGNDSTPAYSGTLKRNSAPTDPKNFKVNSSSLFVKNQIPLTWNLSNDIDGDTVRYNISFSINNGAFQSLVKGLTTTSYTHNISNISVGSVLNYYVEAYDDFNVFSNKVYIASKPQINIPPSASSFVLPYENRTLYTNVPRIVFRTGSSYNDEKLIIIISVNGKEYRSDRDISYFDKNSYENNVEGMFIIPDSAPLNYSKNTVTIKSFDGMDYSTVSSRTLICDAITVTTKSTGDSIKAVDINSLKTMINANRFAYGVSEYVWHDGFLQSNSNIIDKKYFQQVVDAIHSLTTFINNKTNSASLKRIYTKDVIVSNNFIYKNIFNNIYDMIKKS